MELRAWIDYKRPRTQLSYWRSVSNYEVDFILDDEVAIEVKAATVVQGKHLAGLRALREEDVLRRYILVCREERPLLIDGIEAMPWRYFLEALWGGMIIQGT